MAEVRHSIKLVAKRTGLSTHLIRAWEKRYGTIRPRRTDGNRRYYNQEDIERLTLLRQATASGHAIGDIAALTTQQLMELVAGDSLGRRKISSVPVGNAAGIDWVEAAFQAVLTMDIAALEGLLDGASMELGQVRMLREVVVPLVERIGSAWLRGELKVSQEHIASAAIRTYLGQMARPIALHPAAPGLLSTTPAGQLHELGAVLVAAVATLHGWRVIYGGPSLPAEEIASAAVANRVKVVALSIIHPSDDPTLSNELIRLRRLLPTEIQIITGGRASEAYGETLDKVGALWIPGLEALETHLESLRAASV
jgi:MerR family transcriptional regulator, light-induced transcriptional regulator